MKDWIALKKKAHHRKFLKESVTAFIAGESSPEGRTGVIAAIVEVQLEKKH